MWHFNPFANLIRQSTIRSPKALCHTLNARTLRSSLWTKFKDSCFIYFGSNPLRPSADVIYPDVDGEEINVGLFDYATLMIPRFISQLLWALMIKLIRWVGEQGDKITISLGINIPDAVSLLVIFLLLSPILLPIVFAIATIDIIPRFVFLSVMLILTSPIILITHLVSSLIAKPLKEEAQKVCGDLDLDAIEVISIERRQNSTNAGAKVVYKIANRSLFDRLLWGYDYATRWKEQKLVSGTLDFKHLSTFHAFRQLNIGNVNAAIAKKNQENTPSEENLKCEFRRLLFFKNNEEKNFAALPNEILVKIAAETRDPTVHTKADATSIVQRWF